MDLEDDVNFLNVTDCNSRRQELGGGATFDRLKQMDPEVKVLLYSGYRIDGQAREILERGCKEFIRKPFTLNDPAAKVKAVLEG